MRGRTNSEIGQALGISLDGAKWHVSEVITKLGVDSREEAAEYWRVHNGLRPRFSRAVRGFLLGMAWPKLAVTAVLVLVAAAGGALFIAVLGSAGPSTNQPAAAGSTTATAAAPSPTGAADAGGAIRGVLATLTPIPLPNTAQISAAPGGVVWAVVAGQVLFRSTDDGTTWEQRPVPAIQGRDAPGGDVSFVDGQHGWDLVPGSPGTQCQAQSIGLWRTGDGGATWEPVSPTEDRIFTTLQGIDTRQCKDTFSFTDASHGFIDAWDPNSPPIIYRTLDGGDSWTASAPLPDPPGQVTVPGGSSLRAGRVSRFGNELLVDAVGFEHLYVYRSTDDGGSWSYLATVPDSQGTGNVAFLDALHWWAVSSGPGQQVTTDGGKTWEAAPGNLNFAAPIAPVITFGDSLVGYATVRGEIQRTTDGGLHWTRLQTPGTAQTP